MKTIIDTIRSRTGTAPQLDKGVEITVGYGITGSGGVNVGGAVTCGNITATDATFSGTLTYDDVTNVDAVGYATFRSGINVQGAGSTTTTLNVSGISTFTGQLNADNLRFDRNAITSTDSNGAITITPDGTGQITLGGNYVAVTNELAASDVAISSELLMGAGSKIVSNATNEDLTLATNGTGVVTTASQVTLTGSFLQAIQHQS